MLLMAAVACAQTDSLRTQTDGLRANRLVTRATTYGIGSSSLLDTYLSTPHLHGHRDTGAAREHAPHPLDAGTTEATNAV